MALKLWNGSSWNAVGGLKVWNGSTWTSAQTGRIWDGASWQSFYSVSSPLFLPASISALAVDQAAEPYQAYTRINVNSDGSLIVSIGANGVDEPTTNYTWKLSGVASDYEVRMTTSTAEYNWTSGNVLDSWLNLASSRFWEFSVTINSGSEATYTVNSTLSIRKTSNLLTVSCPVAINLILGAL
jgi:hypothetical protein